MIGYTAVEPPRPRAARHRRCTCKSWLTEAAYRMIQNNLDPEVAENPDELVVYGGIGRAARNWDCFDAILERCASSRTTRRCWSSRASRSACSARTPTRRACCIANSNLVPKWATWEHFNELDRKGLMMYGQMTAGLVDLHRQPGHRAGHLRDLRRGRPPALRRRSRGPLDPHRGPGRHGRRAAAGRDLGRRLAARRSSASRAASTSACARATSTSRRTTSTRRWR